jgi:thiamine biosynthesis protein ThiS
VEIEIYLNGERRAVPDGLTVAGLVSYLNLVPERLAVEYNSQILKRVNWDKRLVSAGDKVEIVHFVGGGRLD